MSDENKTLNDIVNTFHTVLTDLEEKKTLIEYKQEGFAMFSDMMSDNNREILKRIFRTNISHLSENLNQAPQVTPRNMKMQHDESPGPGFMPPPQAGSASQQRQMQKVEPINAEKKIGRNEKIFVQSPKGEKVQIKFKKLQQYLNQGYTQV